MAALVIGVLFLTFKGLKCYTGHGDFEVIPDLTGKVYEDAMKFIHQEDLFEVIINDSVFVNGKMPLEILDQDPKPKSKVKKGRKIYLSVNKAQIPLVNIKAKSLFENNKDIAVEYLSRLGFVITKVNTRASTDYNKILEVFQNDKKVMDISSKAKSIKLPKGSEISLVVAESRTNTSLVEIPKLVCTTFLEAKFIIESNRLNIGSVISDGTVRDTSTAYIWKQQPAYLPGEFIYQGRDVNLWISQQPQNCDEILGDDQLYDDIIDDEQVDDTGFNDSDEQDYESDKPAIIKSSEILNDDQN